MNLPGIVPSSLFHSGRAQCPDCGAALDLIDHQPIVRCGYCGGSSVVERRLRTIEPNISGDFLTADAPPDQARESKPSHIINAVAQDESHCPTCGSELEPAQTQAIRQCPYCKTQSKVERRLRRSPDSDQELAKMEAEAQEYEKRQFAQTQALIEEIETSKDLPTRVRAAREWATPGHTPMRARRGCCGA